MYAKVNSMGLMGLNAFSVVAEIEGSKGLPAFDIVGLADAAVKESRERIRSAFRISGLSFPQQRLLINLAPADVKKSGSVHDMAIAVAILLLTEQVDMDYIAGSVFIGEVGLSGEIRSVRGVLPMGLQARQSGFKRIFVPLDDLREASVIRDMECYGVRSLAELAMHLRGEVSIVPAQPYKPKPRDKTGLLDFSDVKGQALAKYALEIAAAGGHNLMMIGPPGSGKSMLAKRLPSILPDMTFEESLMTTNIHSVAGKLDKDEPFVTVRPFRSPHHTVSAAGLAGGGSVPRPGEISLAHNGLLFLDEMPEFSRQALEILRQPLEDQEVTISRVSGSVTYPCSFMLIGAMNPCPCGYFGHPTRKCICSKKMVTNYLNKISGPLLDRFDLHVDVAPVNFEELSSRKKEESSAAILERVQRARDIQNKRYEGTGITCNARVTSALMDEVCVRTGEADKALEDLIDGLGLSARAYVKILKVARTIADMEGAEKIDRKHIATAAQFRSLDRKYWQE